MTEEPPLPEITVNGAERSVTSGASVADLVSELTGRLIASDGHATDGTRLGVAVAQNAAVVPRSRWSTTLVAAGDDIEIVTAVQGG